jgi:hypothetical protein
LQDKQLEMERKKSEAILDNMMPRYVTNFLLAPQNAGMNFAEKEPHVSILFADIMDFADIVATVSRMLVPAIDPFGGCSSNPVHSWMRLLLHMLYVLLCSTLRRSWCGFLITCTLSSIRCASSTR